MKFALFLPYWEQQRQKNLLIYIKIANYFFILLVILKYMHCVPLSDIIISLLIESDMHEIHNWSWFSKEGNYFFQGEVGVLSFNNAFSRRANRN